MNNPLLTVLMPVHNAAPYLKEAIDSILTQTYTHFEFLIINDGSTDQSDQIIRSYNDTRIRYVKNETNLKLIATLNNGIQLAKGTYIVRMDADDISLPERLQHQVDFMERNPEVAICGTWFETFGEKNTIVKYKTDHQDIMYKMLYQCHLAHPTTIMRINQIKSFETIFDPFFAHAEDYDFFTRVGHKYKIANIPEVLLKYRVHPNSVSVQYNDIQNINSLTIRHREFKNMGYDISGVLLEDFRSLNHYSPEKIKSTAIEVQDCLENMIIANKKSNTFDQEFLETTLSFLWFNYCYRIVNLKTFYKSKVLSSHIRVKTSEKLKWFIRNLLKL